MRINNLEFIYQNGILEITEYENTGNQSVLLDDEEIDALIKFMGAV